MKKAILSTAVAVLAGVSLLLPASVAPAKADEQKTADVYILAGQSNAVGCSNLDQSVYGGTGTYRTYLKTDDARNEKGYENVLYYGAVNMKATDETLPDPKMVPVKMDLGQYAGFSGPELGIANILSESATKDHPAIIIKFAASGSHMGDYNGRGGGNYSPDGTHFTEYFGNWAAPSTIARWKEETERNGKAKKIHKNTGLLYNRLVDFVLQGMEKIEDAGYKPTIKGYLWMQGESDSEDKNLAAAYKQNLTEFIGDIRKDIAETVEDKNAEHRPFVIGKVTPTYNMGVAYGITDLIKNQVAVAAELPCVYTVETEDLPLWDSVGKDWCGSDPCHFNAKDIYTLGQRFAQTALDKTVKYVYATSFNKGGSAAQKEYLSNGEPVTIEYKADEGYELVKILFNGEDVTASAGKDTISFTPTDSDEFYQTVTFEFKKSPFPAWGIALICLGVAAAGAVAAVITVEILKRKKKPTEEQAEQSEEKTEIEG